MPDSSAYEDAAPAEILTSLKGRILDADAHEMYPATMWADEYGAEIGAPLAEIFLQSQSKVVPNSFSVDVSEDVQPITPETIAKSWGTGCKSLGAFDMRRRLDAMDAMGVKECFLFGSVMAIYGHQMATTVGDFLGADNWFSEGQRPALDGQDDTGGGAAAQGALALGYAALKAHNDWCIRTARISPRLRPVATILTYDLRESLKECERLVSAGVRAIAFPAGQSIAGKAPAHPDNDVLWKLLSDTRTALLFHVGGEIAFRRETTAWANAPVFEGNNTVPTEIPIDPFSMATSNLALQNYLTNLIFGGVFERFPELRCGVMEYCGYWVGPLAENLDLWGEQFSTRMARTLSMKPSEYIHRNIRVSPFDFEPVDQYIDRFPFLADVYCFATDYPHYEGGKDPIVKMIERTKRFGPAVIEKLFTGNAAWIMPA